MAKNVLFYWSQANLFMDGNHTRVSYFLFHHLPVTKYHFIYASYLCYDSLRFNRTDRGIMGKIDHNIHDFDGFS